MNYCEICSRPSDRLIVELGATQDSSEALTANLCVKCADIAWLWRQVFYGNLRQTVAQLVTVYTSSTPRHTC